MSKKLEILRICCGEHIFLHPTRKNNDDQKLSLKKTVQETHPSNTKQCKMLQDFEHRECKKVDSISVSL